MSSAQPDLTGSSVTMPVFFIGHGSPIKAIEDNELSRALKPLWHRRVINVGSGTQRTTCG
jgi:aromatic ring-opening dioxygenase catalytic subunit (LigB family)